MPLPSVVPAAENEFGPVRLTLWPANGEARPGLSFAADPMAGEAMPGAPAPQLPPAGKYRLRPASQNPAPLVWGHRAGAPILSSAGVVALEPG